MKPELVGRAERGVVVAHHQAARAADVDLLPPTNLYLYVIVDIYSPVRRWVDGRPRIMSDSAEGDERGGSRRIDPLDLHREAVEQRLSVRKLLRVVAGALPLTWQASHRGLVSAAILQIVGALSISALVVVGQLALNAILSAQRGAIDLRELVIVIVLLAVVTAVGSAAGTLQQQQQRLLSEEGGCPARR